MVTSMLPKVFIVICVAVILFFINVEGQCFNSPGSSLQLPNKPSNNQKYVFNGFAITTEAPLGDFEVRVHQTLGDEGQPCFKFTSDGYTNSFDDTACKGGKITGIYIRVHTPNDGLLEKVCRFDGWILEAQTVDAEASHSHIAADSNNNGGSDGSNGGGNKGGNVGKYNLIGTPLSGVCLDRTSHEYCEIKGDCGSADHIIRNLMFSSYDSCKRACDVECGCRAFRLWAGSNCFLSSAPCSTMDNTLLGWKFYVKAAKGQTCDDAKFGCRKQASDYCERLGDCAGHNIRNVLTGAGNCKHLCDNECACHAYFHDELLSCWLKSIACTKRSSTWTLWKYHIKKAQGTDCQWAIENQCREQKFKYCSRHGDCLGHNIRHESKGLLDCKQACDRECACKAFYHDRMLGCWLKSIACTKLSHGMATSDYYVKIGLDDTCPHEFGEEVPGGFQ